MAFGESDFPKDEKYLKEYEEKIRQLPYEELEDVLSVIEGGDKSPERIHIVKKRMAELEPLVKAAEDEKEKRHQRVVENYEKNRTKAGPILWVATLLMLVLALLTWGEGSGFVFCGVAITIFVIWDLRDKMISIRGSRIYKEEHPKTYRVFLMIEACTALAFFIYGIYLLSI